MLTGILLFNGGWLFWVPCLALSLGGLVFVYAMASSAVVHLRAKRMLRRAEENMLMDESTAAHMDELTEPPNQTPKSPKMMLKIAQHDGTKVVLALIACGACWVGGRSSGYGQRDHELITNMDERQGIKLTAKTGPFHYMGIFPSRTQEQRIWFCNNNPALDRLEPGIILNLRAEVRGDCWAIYPNSHETWFNYEMDPVTRLARRFDLKEVSRAR